MTEQDGSDNPVGDGEDETSVDGSSVPDGQRDDLNDSAWTTPIWFTTGSAAFVWSKNSNLYHDPDCWAAARIGAANRREGPAPSGKTKHNCPN